MAAPIRARRVGPPVAERSGRVRPAPVPVRARRIRPVVTASLVRRNAPVVPLFGGEYLLELASIQEDSATLRALVDMYATAIDRAHWSLALRARHDVTICELADIRDNNIICFLINN